MALLILFKKKQTFKGNGEQKQNFRTLRRLVTLLLTLLSSMCFQSATARKSLLALAAFVRQILNMATKMCLQIDFPRKNLPAQSALKRFLTRVRVTMQFQRFITFEAFVAL